MGTPEIITTVILAALTLGIAIPFMVRAYLQARRDREKWRSLVGIAPFSYIWKTGDEPLPFPESVLVAKFNFAVECIAAQGPWSRTAVAGALVGVRIIVIDVDSWMSNAGVMVSGQAIVEQGLVQVGPAMRALCHELCHLLTYRLYGEFDDDHASFETRGFNRAEMVYLGAAGSA